MVYNSNEIDQVKEFKVKDTVKCKDSNDAMHTICQLIRREVHTQIFNREPDGSMTITVTRTGGKFD